MVLMNDIFSNSMVKIIVKMLLIIMALIGVIYILVPKYISTCGCPKYPEEHAMNAAIRELNGRESLMWTEQKQSGTYKNDIELFKEMRTKKKYFLDENYEWMSNISDPPIPVGQPQISGGKLSFQKKILRLYRTASEIERPAIWRVAE